MFRDDGSPVLKLQGWFRIRASSHLLSHLNIVTSLVISSAKALNSRAVQADLDWVLKSVVCLDSLGDVPGAENKPSPSSSPSA